MNVGQKSDYGDCSTVFRDYSAVSFSHVELSMDTFLVAHLKAIERFGEFFREEHLKNIRRRSAGEDAVNGVTTFSLGQSTFRPEERIPTTEESAVAIAENKLNSMRTWHAAVYSHLEIILRDVHPGMSDPSMRIVTMALSIILGSEVNFLDALTLKMWNAASAEEVNLLQSDEFLGTYKCIGELMSLCRYLGYGTSFPASYGIELSQRIARMTSGEELLENAGIGHKNTD